MGFAEAIHFSWRLISAPFIVVWDFIERNPPFEFPYHMPQPNIRINSIVRWNDAAVERNVHFWGALHDPPNIYTEKHLVYLGEVVDMPGHGIFAGQSGKVYFGYHTDDFEEVEQ